MQAASEAEVRRSAEASMAERVKQEKLNLSRKALELGKQKVSPVCCTHITHVDGILPWIVETESGAPGAFSSVSCVLPTTVV